MRAQPVLSCHLIVWSTYMIFFCFQLDWGTINPVVELSTQMMHLSQEMGNKLLPEIWSHFGKKNPDPGLCTLKKERDSINYIEWIFYDNFKLLLFVFILLVSDLVYTEPRFRVFFMAKTGFTSRLKCWDDCTTENSFGPLAVHLFGPNL